MSKYFAKLKAPKGQVIPPLLARFAKWLAKQEYGTFGTFELISSPVPGELRDAWCFLSLPEGSLLALVSTVAPAPVVLFDSESDALKVVAPSLEAFLLALGAGKTRLDDLNEGDDRDALRVWLANEKVKAPKPAKFNVKAYQRDAAPAPVESEGVKKLPPLPRGLVALLGRKVSDTKLPAELKKLKLPAKLPKTGGKLQDKKRGITVSVGRNGVISEVHLGEKYDGPLAFKLPSGVNDFTATKLLGKPTGTLKKKDGGKVWEKVLDAERGLYFSRSRGHFDWWSEHRFFLKTK
ncbi:SMI1/KNR4 family protein [Corallococcus praedator]|uniref:SMI1/KNR4 family protein n=1 Tax=Corallococcus praedator TaxID=2316724 RepID=A0ABX9QI17_9BACT|nr:MULTISPECIES: SMI1/KNR4 family protein [Corallococcus]RKH34055.1 SMI1/KNR4 family protein [Corallococcus sp. CA031C]RKI08282.1 SMI1/KNR4 family protein [Corallococcus praedator]